MAAKGLKKCIFRESLKRSGGVRLRNASLCRKRRLSAFRRKLLRLPAAGCSKKRFFRGLRFWKKVFLQGAENWRHVSVKTQRRFSRAASADAGNLKYFLYKKFPSSGHMHLKDAEVCTVWNFRTASALWNMPWKTAVLWKK